LNLKFENQKSFDDCINIKKLKFDFYLPDYNTCIEFDGAQHFRPIDRFGGEEYFNYIKLCDSIKNRYCVDKDIKLIRISYKEYGKIGKIIYSVL
jgi:hypothetical protein